MGEPSDEDTEALRLRARELIEQGRLPRAKALRTWGGLGTGLRCDLCDAPIASSEPEFELQLDLTSTDSVRFHRPCHAIWNEAREEWRPGGWRAIARGVPPFGAVVEARVSLSRSAEPRPEAPRAESERRAEPRAIILNVIRLDESQPGVWINATTGGPLPEGWVPVEWRPLAAAGVASGADAGPAAGAGASTAASGGPAGGRAPACAPPTAPKRA